MANEKAREKYNDWLHISNTPGWKAFKEELDKLLESYSLDMDNENLDGNALKRVQLIKKGLKMARDIPSILEIRSKTK
jgi:hypothetical protein